MEAAFFAVKTGKNRKKSEKWNTKSRDIGINCKWNG